MSRPAIPSTSTSTCRTCGAPLPAGARFCPECGGRVAGAPAAPAPPVRRFGASPSSAWVAASRALTRLRAHGRAVVESVAAQTQAQREIAAVRYELERLRGERGERLRALGTAVYGGDEQGTEAERAALRELDDRIAAKEAEMTQIAERAQERAGQARLEAQSTVLLEPAAPVPEPYPPPVPEPYPPPDEGTPPTPEPVPEPYPPPDEGDPPRQP